ncbi:MAG: hypothetical protein H8E37_02500 [Planctomycetes bacterium]|nr:hypothetical protein [Planctomycetota bacterium]
MLAAVSLAGCGKTMQHAATEQLVLSDAVDQSVSSIDFTPLSGAKCFLDSSNLKSVKLTNVVNSSYVISSIRNQLMAAGCLLVEDRSEAQVVIEPRLGTLGADAHEVTYGIPSSNLLSQAASLVPTSPPIPTIPEISLAKKDDQTGAAKVAVFAYDASTGRPLWQSGTTTARSTSRNLWVFGIGPFQSGSVHEAPQFAGAEMSLPLAEQKRKVRESRQVVTLDDAFLFGNLPEPKPASEIQPASAEETPE